MTIVWRVLKVLMAIGIYGTAIEPWLVVRNDETAAIPNLPPAWEGKQVAVFADIQVGMWWANTDAVRRLVRSVVEIHPALVLVAGDFVYNAEGNVDDQMTEVVGILRPILDSGIPIYGVLGNHDYELMNEHSDQENRIARHVTTALERAGVRMMDNKVVALPSPSRDSGETQPLYLAGIGEKWARDDHALETISQVPESAPRIVFMHDPDSFAQIPAGLAPLGVAAHTHGLQVGVPFVSDYLWRHFFSDEGYGVEGWINTGAAGNRLYVNRGVGFSNLPARVHAFPELTLFTLHRP